MKLQVFDSSNMASQRRGDCTIRFSRKGASYVSKALVAALGLEDGTTVSVHQDEESPEDWYLSFGEENGFPLRQPKDADSLAFNSAAMANAILDALGLEEHDSVAFKVATEATEVEGWGADIRDFYYVSNRQEIARLAVAWVRDLSGRN